MGSCGTDYGILVGYFKRGTEPSGSLKCWKIFD